jgi:hypothetical protein
LLIPFAASSDEGCVQARRTLRLPALDKLLARLKPTASDEGDEHTLSMPHECVLARACGLPAADGRIPWAAWQVAQSGRDTQGAAWAWITPWMPRGPEAKGVRRLQQEMQMLLYTHEINEERTRGGQEPINSFWVSGTGALAGFAAAPAGLVITHDLRDAAMRQDWSAWAAAWHRLDAGECTRLLQALDRGEHVSLTLCGERNARTWSGNGGGFFAKIAASLSGAGGKRIDSALDSL